MSNPFANAARSKTPVAAGNVATAPAAAAPAAAAPAANDVFSAPPSTIPDKPAAAPAAGGDPFGMPSGPGAGGKITDYLGHLLIVTPVEIVKDMVTSIGTTDVVRADVVVLDGEEPGLALDGMLIFQIALRRDLERILRGNQPMLLGRLGQGAAKPGKNAPYIFLSPSEEDMTLARQYLAAKAAGQI